jgi:Tfp pilus assembly protein PilX
MMRSDLRSSPDQRGATLVVALVMLLVMTVMVVASFRLGISNLGIVGNTQSRNQSIGAAQQTIEEAISSNLLTTSPASIFPAPCSGPNTQCYDVDGDATNDVTVTIDPPPSCVKAETIKNSSLDLTLEEDRRCTLGIPQNFGTPGGGTSNSLCSNSLWDVRAVAEDLNTRTTAVVNQGVGLRVRTADVATSCP